MYLLVLISTLINLSEARAYVSPYYEDIQAIGTIIAILTALVGFFVATLRYLPKHIPKSTTPKDAEILVDYNKYFYKKEREKLDVEYIPRIENNIERDVIAEVTDFLKSSEPVLIISGESGLGKTRIAIEISKIINGSKTFAGGFKYKRKCRFVDIRRYPNPKGIEEKLNAELLNETVLIFDDYQYSNMESFNKVKDNALKRNTKIIVTTRPLFVKALKEKLEGQALFKHIELKRMDISEILKNKDEDLKWEIEKISEGTPAIALLAVDYINENPDKNAKYILKSIRTSQELFDKIIRDFQKRYEERSGEKSGEDFIEFLAAGELIGGVTDEDIPQKYEKTMADMEATGHIVKRESGYHLTPDILSEYLIDHMFFTSTLQLHSIEELAKDGNGTHILEMLNSVLKIKDEKREIYRQAAAKLLEIVDQLEPDIEQRKKRIKAGIMVYNGFGDLNLITEKLRDFWRDYEVLDTENDLSDLGVFLINISKPFEAQKCLEKAKEIFEKKSDKAGISPVIHNLGIIQENQGNYEEAVDLYNQSLEIEKELGNKSGIANSLHELGNIHYLQGNYEEAVDLYNQSLEIDKELGNKSGIADSLHQLGIFKQNQGNYEEAVDLYNQSLEINKELGKKSGIASSLYQLGNIHYLQGNYEKAVDLYNQSLEIEKELGNKSGIAISLHVLGMVNEAKEEYIVALQNYLDACSIFKKLKSPYSQTASKQISQLREKMGETEFKKALEKLGSKLDE